MAPLDAAMKQVAALACILLLSGPAAAQPATPTLGGAAASHGVAIDRLVADVCDKRVVLLGEDAHHASGETFSVKARIVERLVDECGFSAVLFESQIYDFLGLEEAFASRRATLSMLDATAGGFWGPTAEFQPLAAFLLDRAGARQVLLGGVDPQPLGATQRYTRQHLAGDLTAVLEGATQRDCANDVSRLAKYEFDADHPDDDAFRARLRGCVAAIQAALPPGATGQLARVEAMARNLGAYLDMSAGDADTVRDRAMAANVAWYLDRLPTGAKAIVWCATVHAAKQRTGPRRAAEPMGELLQRSFGADSASVGIVAASGSRGWRNESPTRIAPASPGSLAAIALADSDTTMRYLDAGELEALGGVPSRAFNAIAYTTASWNRMLDGILVIREEHPPRYMESPP